MYRKIMEGFAVRIKLPAFSQRFHESTVFLENSGTAESLMAEFPFYHNTSRINQNDFFSLKKD